MTIEKRLLVVALIILGLLLVVPFRVAYWQLWMGKKLNPVVLDPAGAAVVYARLQGNSAAPNENAGSQSGLSALPQPVIQRTVRLLASIKRGTIYDRAGNILAEDSGAPGKYIRVYHDLSLAHGIGYTSALRIGINGLEETYNESLLGLDRPDATINQMLNKPLLGSSLKLTIDPNIQKSAASVLGNRPGAVLVLDGNTGAVLAMTSAPGFDPNKVNQPDYLSGLGDGSPLLNRATQGLFTPGSTWKTVTLITALDTGLAKPDTVFNFGKPRTRADGSIYYVYPVDGAEVVDGNHKQSQLDLTMSYAFSANYTFAKLANEMDPNVFIDYAARMGFSSPDYEKRFPLELPAGIPQLANDVNNIRTNNVLRASTGYGQGELLTTPINMAMIVEAVLNHGSIPLPYLVENILDPQGKVIRERPNRHMVNAIMKAGTAEEVKHIMKALVDTILGGVRYIGYPDVEMGLKTGTAQLGGNSNPHGWVIGYAEKNDKCVVIVVLLENGGGSSPALQVFQKVAQSAIANYLLDK